MDNVALVKKWHDVIIQECEKRLCRKVTIVEETFVTSHSGFIALETIEDSVKSKLGKELEDYLNAGNYEV